MPAFSSTAAIFRIEPFKPIGHFPSHCPVSADRLRDVTVSYYDFQGSPHQDGHIIVLDAVAKHVVAIFQRLYDMKFPIDKIRPVQEYNNDDNASMRANNSSSFNCRPMTGKPPGSLPSIHAYGLAIDINPIQNPYIGFDPKRPSVTEILPVLGKEYVHRHPIRPGMVESIVPIFKEQGFSVWGGNWKTPIDYQHFQTTRAIAEQLAQKNPQEAEKFFETTR